MKAVFSLTALPALSLRACIRRQCTARIDTRSAAPFSVTLPPARGLAPVDAEQPPLYGAAGPPAQARAINGGYRQEVSAPVERTVLASSGFLAFNATPADIVMQARQLALSPNFTLLGRSGAADVTGHTNENCWSSAASSRPSFPEKLRLQAQGQRSTRTSATAAAAGSAASWGDLIFRAHGLLHAFAPSQLLLLLQWMATAGPVSIAHCSRSPVPSQQPTQCFSHLQKQQQHQQQQRHKDFLQSPYTRENPLAPHSSLPPLCGSGVDKESCSVTAVDRRNQHPTQTVSRSHHRDSDRGTVKSGTASVVGGSKSVAVSSAASRVCDSCVRSSTDRYCLADGSNVCGAEAATTQANLHEFLRGSYLSRAPIMSTHQLQGRSVDFLEAIIERLCADQVLEQLPIDDIATAVNSLHLLQYALPFVLVKRLRDTRLPCPVFSAPLPDTEKVVTISTNSFYRECVGYAAPRGSGNSSSNERSFNSEDASPRRDHECSEYGRDSSRLALLADDPSSDNLASRNTGVDYKSISRNLSNTGSGRGDCLPDSRGTVDHSKRTSGRHADGRTDSDPHVAALGTATASNNQQRSVHQQYGKPNLPLSSSSGGGKFFEEANAVMVPQQSQRDLNWSSSAGLLASKLAAFLTHLNRETVLREGRSPCVLVSEQQRNNKVRSVTTQLQWRDHEHGSEKTLINRRTAVAAIRTPFTDPENMAAPPVLPDISRPPPKTAAGTRVAAPGVAAEVLATLGAASCPGPINSAEKDKRQEMELPPEGQLSGDLVALAASAKRQCVPTLSRLTQIWHCCCSMGLLSPELASHVLTAFDKSAKAPGLEDLVLLIRAGVMHLTRQPLVHPALISLSTVLCPPRWSSRINAYNVKWSGAADEVRSRRSHERTLQYAEDLPDDTLHDGESMAALMRYLDVPEMTDEARVDAAVSKLIDRSLRHVQEQMISLDMRHIALLLEAFALASFSPEPLTTDLLERCVLPRVTTMRPEAVTSVISSLNALEIRCDKLLHAVSHRLCEAASQYSPSALALLALYMAKLDHVASPLLSDVFKAVSSMVQWCHRVKPSHRLASYSLRKPRSSRLTSAGGCGVRCAGERESAELKTLLEAKGVR